MSTSIVAERVTCLHGGVSGGMYRGHPVLRENMTTMKRGKTTIHICVDCKAKKMERDAEAKRRRCEI